VPLWADVKGKALSDVLLALVRWGKKHIPGTDFEQSSAAFRARPKTTPGSKIKAPVTYTERRSRAFKEFQYRSEGKRGAHVIGSFATATFRVHRRQLFPKASSSKP
jgi:hypothetical protein